MFTVLAGKDPRRLQHTRTVLTPSVCVWHCRYDSLVMEGLMTQHQLDELHRDIDKVVRNERLTLQQQQDKVRVQPAPCMCHVGHVPCPSCATAGQ